MASPSPSGSPARGYRSRLNSTGGDNLSISDTNSAVTASSLPQTLWNLQVPLYITHTSQPTTPFITAVPRFGYLALLLPRLSAYYGAPCSSFHHEEIQLRNLAVGLLVDLYQPTLPWRLVVGDGPEWDIGDTFMNSAKEVRLSLIYLCPICTCRLCFGIRLQSHTKLTNHRCITHEIGRFCPQRQRKADHEPIQGGYHHTVECRTR